MLMEAYDGPELLMDKGPLKSWPIKNENLGNTRGLLAGFPTNASSPQRRARRLPRRTSAAFLRLLISADQIHRAVTSTLTAPLTARGDFIRRPTDGYPQPGGRRLLLSSASVPLFWVLGYWQSLFGGDEQEEEVPETSQIVERC